MPPRPPGSSQANSSDSKLVAVLGPTNTGKTHLAIERLCAHSSGAIGFPLRLLAREVYERVCAIKGPNQVALITGEERIEPPGARWFLCTVEAMPTVHAKPKAGDGSGLSGDLAFVAIDEAQLCANRERGHVFTDRLLHARGRNETMILGSAAMEPMVRALLPQAEVISRPRFSTLSHTGAKKLSRVPPRSAIVAFSAEQVYAVAELLRRFRGGAAVVMGALSPETRNRQVELFQSGEVDYLVATDAIGMGLNLDLGHVAFAGLAKFDGQRQRRLTPAEMAQIAGRAGRHHRDGTFGTLSGTRSHDAAFTSEEVYAIEEHRFAPIPRIYWRESEPRLDCLSHLIEDLSLPPDRPELAPAPEAIDLAVMRRLAEEQDIADSVKGQALVSRFRDVCMLPDFRQQGAEVHARFVARLWQDLRSGALPAGYIAARIAELDIPGGDIDALQGRIAAIRSWAYIAQRKDWVVAREEMAARARAVEARLSDALHSRLTERFVNRRLTVLMKGAGADAGLLPVETRGDEVLIDGEPIGKIEGFRFKVDPEVGHDDHKLFFAAAEKHLPQLLAERARTLSEAIAAGTGELVLSGAEICNHGEVIARLERSKALLEPRLTLAPALDAVPDLERAVLAESLTTWLTAHLAVLAPLARLDQASREESSGTELRALLIRLAESGGVLLREGSGLEALDHGQRKALRRLRVNIGALDLYVPAMLRPAAQEAWHALSLARGRQLPPVIPGMPSVIDPGKDHPPHGYRRVGKQAIRVDLADRLLEKAHERRTASGRRPFPIDEALARSMGLTADCSERLFRQGGFKQKVRPPLPEGQFGPPAPVMWLWLPPQVVQSRKAKPERIPDQRAAKPARAGHTKAAAEGLRATSGGAFDALAVLLGPAAK